MNRDKRILDNEQEQKEESQMKLQKSFYQLRSFGENFEPRNRKEELEAIMEQEIGRLWKWKGKWDFKTLHFARLPLNFLSPPTEHRARS